MLQKQKVWRHDAYLTLIVMSCCYSSLSSGKQENILHNTEIFFKPKYFWILDEDSYLEVKDDGPYETKG